MIKAIIPLADGVEEMEAVIIIDVLRRAGWRAVFAGLREGKVTASRRVALVPDSNWDELDLAGFDALVIPGGSEAADTLQRDERILSAVREFVAADKIVGAICAGPLVLERAGVLHGRKFTCYPGLTISLGERLDDRVVVDGKLVTGQGPAMALEFALALAGLIDEEKARKVAAALLL